MLYLLVILGITVGFALLSTTLFINGTAAIKSNTWNIHWDDTSVNVTQGSVAATAPNVTTTTSTKDTVSFSVNLELPGDFYEFEIDAINEGSVDGALDLLTTKLYASNDLEHPLTGANIPSYLLYSVKYSDGTTPASGDVLKHGTSKTYKIRVEIDSEADEEDLPDDDEEYVITVTNPYIQYKETCTAPVSFSSDSWETIACNVRTGNTSKYNIGDTKSVEVNGFGTHNVRIANKSTPNECKTTGFSQSGCGFVVEFEDVMYVTIFNPSGDYDTNGYYAKGGWEHSSLRNFMSTAIYPGLPTELKNAIIDTPVVSSYGERDSANFNTVDRLYLLSTKEVWGKDGTTFVVEYDTSEAQTRQLDYYLQNNVTTTNHEGAIKQYNGSNFWWWTRSAISSDRYRFYFVSDSGYPSDAMSNASSGRGVSPAFRIG